MQKYLKQNRKWEIKYITLKWFQTWKPHSKFIASKQSSHTRAERNFRYSNPAFCDEQLLQTTWKQSKYSLVMLYAWFVYKYINQLAFPQARQWWRLKVILKAAVQSWHIVTRLSGIHTGALLNMGQQKHKLCQFRLT